MKENIICYCKQVSEATIVQAIRNGAHTLGAIQKATGACTGTRCKELNPKGRCCSSDILELLHRTKGIKVRKDGCCCEEECMNNSRTKNRKEG